MSEITVSDVASYLKIEREDLTSSLALEIEGFLKAAKQYVKTYTGLDEEGCDEHEDISIAVFILCADFYDNRAAYVTSNQSIQSKTLECILGMYQENLL